MFSQPAALWGEQCWICVQVLRRRRMLVPVCLFSRQRGSLGVGRQLGAGGGSPNQAPVPLIARGCPDSHPLCSQAGTHTHIDSLKRWNRWMDYNSESGDFDSMHEKGNLKCIQNQVSISWSKFVKRQNEWVKFQNSGRRNYTAADIFLPHTSPKQPIGLR